MGGLDICFGRMDNPDHFIFDMHYENTRLNDEIIEYWPGIDYSNSRVKDFINVKET
jgi:phospholipase D1/2